MNEGRAAIVREAIIDEVRDHPASPFKVARLVRTRLVSTMPHGESLSVGQVSSQIWNLVDHNVLSYKADAILRIGD